MDVNEILQEVESLCVRHSLDFELAIWSNGWRAIFFELTGDTFEDHDHVPYSTEHENPKEAILGAIDKFEKQQPDRPFRYSKK